MTNDLRREMTVELADVRVTDLIFGGIVWHRIVGIRAVRDRMGIVLTLGNRQDVEYPSNATASVLRIVEKESSDGTT